MKVIPYKLINYFKNRAHFFDSADISIEKVYYKENKPVKYSDKLKSPTSNSQFSDTIIQEGSKAMKELKTEALANLKNTAFNADFDMNAFSNKGAKVIKTGLGSGTFWNFLSNELKLNPNVNPIISHADIPNKGAQHVSALGNDAVNSDKDIQNHFNELFVNKKYYVISRILSRSMP